MPSKKKALKVGNGSKHINFTLRDSLSSLLNLKDISRKGTKNKKEKENTNTFHEGMDNIKEVEENFETDDHYTRGKTK